MPDGSTQSPIQVSVPWYYGAGGLTDVPDSGPNFPNSPFNALCTALRTGDVRVAVGGGIGTPGQVAVQQDNPLPVAVLAFVNEVEPGDSVQNMWPKKQQSPQGRAA
jgi:hypothetical protein